MNRDQQSGLKDRFIFLGNDLVLDFVNTRPLQNGELIELVPDFRALLRWFQAANLLSSGEAAKLQGKWAESSRARHAVEGLQELREKLRKQVLAWEHGSAVQHSTVDELNRLMAQHPMRTRLTTRGGAPAMELWFEPHTPEDLLAPLAHGAARLFADVDRSRVRKCENCVGHFYDNSKKGNRRWCSMQLCGNRLKVAAYAARKRRERAVAQRVH